VLKIVTVESPKAWNCPPSERVGAPEAASILTERIISIFSYGDATHDEICTFFVIGRL
jgi:hypothetical protein